jgi:hypothetical protein
MAILDASALTGEARTNAALAIERALSKFAKEILEQSDKQPARFNQSAWSMQ